MSQPLPGPLSFRTIEIEPPTDLLSVFPRGAHAWIQGGEGLVGWGVAARVPVGGGEGRFERSIKELQGIFTGAEADDEVGVPGTGPLAFGSYTFDPQAEGSVLIVPEVVVGKRNGRAWKTTVGGAEMPSPEVVPEVDSHDFRIRYAGSSISEVEWLEAVAEAAATVARGELEKVVLARDVRIWSKTPFDLAVLVSRLAARFPECFTFCCEGFVGSTPELLVRRTGGDVESLVLAGSAPRGKTQEEDAELGRQLSASEKDLAEHEPALRSVVEILERNCSSLRVPEQPDLLRLQNVQHLASRVQGELSEPLTALELAGSLHPTAAVCGLPRRDALEHIRKVEGLDRARYAGPVGWVDARGDGEWGIGLRCAELEGTRGRLFAGAGIVADSVPEKELEETRLKLRAMMSALESP